MLIKLYYPIKTENSFYKILNEEINQSFLNSEFLIYNKFVTKFDLIFDAMKLRMIEKIIKCNKGSHKYDICLKTLKEIEKTHGLLWEKILKNRELDEVPFLEESQNLCKVFDESINYEE